MKDTKIEWTNHTFNPWKGCTKVSEGCRNCYAEEWAKRFNQVEWNAPPLRTSTAKWREPKKWNREANGRDRVTVFCASLADVFDENAASEWRLDLWNLVRETPNLAWLLLTKRPQNVDAMLPEDLKNADHVWIGCTIENQKRANERLPIMNKLPVKNKFLSVEPLLEPVTLELTDIDWVIVGGESGSNARPFHLEWAKPIIGQCRDTETPVFMKQIGNNAYYQECQFSTKTNKGTELTELPKEFQVREFPSFGNDSGAIAPNLEQTMQAKTVENKREKTGASG